MPFWQEIDALARPTPDVKVAIEMHPQNLVFNPPTMERLVERDRRHPRRRRDGPDPPVLAGHRPGRGGRLPRRRWCFHAAAKDTRINETAKIYGVLDDGSPGSPPDEPGAILGGRYTLSRWPEDVGVGLRRRRPRPRRRVLDRVPAGAGARSTRTWPVNIEHEDDELDQLEGLRSAARDPARGRGPGLGRATSRPGWVGTARPLAGRPQRSWTVTSRA